MSVQSYLQNLVSQILPFSVQADPLSLSPEEQQLIAQLADIQLPKSIGLWPPSIGLVIVFIVLTGIVSLGLFYLNRYVQQSRYRRSALKVLRSIKANPNVDSSYKLISEVNALIKRCAITGIPQSKPIIVSLWGRSFYEFVFSTLGRRSRFSSSDFETLVNAWNKLQYSNLMDSPEQMDLASEEISSYLELAEQWIRYHSHTQVKSFKLNQKSEPANLRELIKV